MVGCFATVMGSLLTLISKQVIALVSGVFFCLKLWELLHFALPDA